MSDTLTNIDSHASASTNFISAGCNLCGCVDVKEVFTVSQLPAHVCVLCDSREDAARAPRGEIQLVHCRQCGHIHNRVYDVGKMVFDPSYEASLEHSATFREHIDSTALRLIERYELRGKHVVEVGCGSGYFLRRICELGGNHGYGFDPSVIEPGGKKVSAGSLKLFRDYYSEKYKDLPCDFLCSLSVMEDIPQPADFIQQMRRIIGDRSVQGYFEVFNGRRAFQAKETFSIHYEQCNYFSTAPFARLFAENGFDIMAAGECYQGDQYVFVEASVNSAKCDIDLFALARVTTDTANDFALEHCRQIEHWRQRLASFKSQCQKVVLWGSGGKGISFLNMAPGSDAISFVVDINPRRQGKFIPGTGHEVVDPNRLVDDSPDLVILSNPLYEAEVKAQLNQLGVECEMVTLS